MKFYRPELLWLLLTLLIPIIIHLFRFRKFKTEPFPYVTLLKNINTKKKKISNIHRWIILSLRLLIMTALVFVFAKPYIPKKNVAAAEAEVVYIYVDNSCSMDAQTETLSLLDNAKKRAKQIVMSYSNNHLFKIFANNTPVIPPVLNKNDAIIAIDNIKVSYKLKKMSTVLSILNLNSSKKSMSYYISDFQATTSDFNDIPDLSSNIYLVPVSKDETSNLSIVEIAFPTPVTIASDKNIVDVTIQNHSEADFEKIPLNLFIEDELVTSTVFNISANSTFTTELSFPDNTPGVKTGVVSINDYSLPFDNSLYFNYIVKSGIKVLDIYSTKPNKFLSALFANDTIFDFETVVFKSVQYDRIKNYDLVILDGLYDISGGIYEEVQQSVINGNCCLICVPPEIDIESYNLFLSKCGFGKIGEITTNTDKNIDIAFDSPFFEDVFPNISSFYGKNIDLPAIYKYYPTDMSEGLNSLIQIADIHVPLYSYKSIESGKIFVSTVPFDSDFSNLPTNALFVPLIYKTAFSCLSTNNISYLPDDRSIKLVPDTCDIDRIRLYCKNAPETDSYSINVINGYIAAALNDNAETLPGNYITTIDEKPAAAFSINGDRDESALKFYSYAEIDDILSESEQDSLILLNASDDSFEKALAGIINDSALWRLFLIICITLLLLEMLLLRIWE
ncbi:MAG: BatA domain-containing protein [Bacteroidales bacterium]|nr:BatA domain-containing protein [Bacteroidales bacterium]